MRLEGTIKSVQASIAPGGADIVQIVKMEVFGEWKNLRDLMSRPLEIKIEPMQLELGNQPDNGSVETEATDGRRGRRKGKVPA